MAEGSNTDAIDALLKRWRLGDDQAGHEVVDAVYSELKRLAGYFFRQERPGHTLQPTAIVHELFVKLFTGEPVEWRDRAHFFAVASRQIHRILIDHARRRGARKRRDTRIPLPDFGGRKGDPVYEDLFAVDEALEALAGLEPRAAQVVELRVFGGLKESEIARALDISIATVKRDWTFARAWLISRLGPTQLR